jgi:hypothetical protein
MSGIGDDSSRRLRSVNTAFMTISTNIARNKPPAPGKMARHTIKISGASNDPEWPSLIFEIPFIFQECGAFYTYFGFS